MRQATQLTRILSLVRIRLFLRNRLNGLMVGLVFMVALLPLLYPELEKGAEAIGPEGLTILLSRNFVVVTLFMWSTHLTVQLADGRRDVLAAFHISSFAYSMASWVEGISGNMFIIAVAASGLVPVAVLSDSVRGPALAAGLWPLVLTANSLGLLLSLPFRRIVRRASDTLLSLLEFAPVLAVFLAFRLSTPQSAPDWLMTLGSWLSISPVAIWATGGAASPVIYGTLVMPVIWTLLSITLSSRVSWGILTPTGAGTGSQRAVSASLSGMGSLLKKDLLLLSRNWSLLSRGLLSAAIIVVPFMIMNSGDPIPFLAVFQIAMYNMAGGLIFSLLLLHSDEQLLWLIRSSGRLRPYVLFKFSLCAVITAGLGLGLSLFGWFISPLTIDMGHLILVSLTSSIVTTSLGLAGGAFALRAGMNFVARQEPSMLVGLMLPYGAYVATLAIAYGAGTSFLYAAAGMWIALCVVALGITLNVLSTMECK